jgi:hypothetical protein
MKYTRLTQEQLEALHQEFAKFLATQSIDAKEWNHLKENKPEIAEQELDIFSDLVWEGALSKVSYVENTSAEKLFLFHFADEAIELLLIKNSNPEVDLTTLEGLEWLQNNIKAASIEIYTSSKGYSEDPNLDKFKLIQQGSVISEGTLFKALRALIN